MRCDLNNKSGSEDFMEEKNRHLLNERMSVLKKKSKLGPAILFFSGGSALNSVSRYLKSYTSNSIHVVTPFDSGGSSAALRNAFAIPAVGDVRNRLLALADDSNPETGPVSELLGRRFSTLVTAQELREELDRLADGIAMGRRVENDPRLVEVCEELANFAQIMPVDFELRGASIGNLVLASRYLRSDRMMTKAISWFSGLIGARGLVAVSADADLHLAARLFDGEVVLGQDRMTGKEFEPIVHAIEDVWLTASRNDCQRVQIQCDSEAAEKIGHADLICYPPGSFFSSLMANLLPSGITDAIAGSDCPKIFVPNRGTDPECPGWQAADAFRALAKRLGHGSGSSLPPNRMLTDVLVDSSDAHEFAECNLQERGIQLHAEDLVFAQGDAIYDPEKLGRALLRLSLGRN